MLTVHLCSKTSIDNKLIDVLVDVPFTTEDDIMFAQHESSTHILPSPTHNGLINAFVDAYNLHRPLRLRPDDIQLAIQCVISTCINNNPKTYRDTFVSHQDKKELIANSTDFDLPYLSDTFKRLMSKSVKNPEFLDKFTTTYTTSTVFTQTVSNIMLMNTLKEYFSFGMMLGCGIPSVQLCGTQEDWLKLKSFYLYFKNFFSKSELNSWFLNFDCIMDMFIEMRNLKEMGEVDASSTIKTMWDHVITTERVGSGGQTELGGWVRLFVPYSSENKLISNLRRKIDWTSGKKYLLDGWNSMQKGTVSTEATINDYNVLIHSGFYTPYYNEDGSVSVNMGVSIVKDTEKDITMYNYNV